MSSSVGSPKKLLNNVKGREIPSRRMIVNDISQLPYDYSSTPGGTLFSTTPGGIQPLVLFSLTICESLLNLLNML